MTVPGPSAVTERPKGPCISRRYSVSDHHNSPVPRETRGVTVQSCFGRCEMRWYTSAWAWAGSPSTCSGDVRYTHDASRRPPAHSRVSRHVAKRLFWRAQSSAVPSAHSRSDRGVTGGQAAAHRWQEYSVHRLCIEKSYKVVTTCTAGQVPNAFHVCRFEYLFQTSWPQQMTSASHPWSREL